MKLLHRHLSRYAVLEVAEAAEALAAIDRASRGMYETPPELIGFSEEGFLVSKQVVDADEPDFRQRWDEFEDETLHLAKFALGSQLLSIELYDDLADPNDPPHADNILMAATLERLCAQEEHAK